MCKRFSKSLKNIKSLLYCFFHQYLIIIASISIIIIFSSISFLIKELANYYYAYPQIEELAKARPDDQNIFAERIVGSYLIPRMIKNNPFMGVGIGNYSLVRNDPKYLKGLPFLAAWDLPGLGLFGYAAEIGRPAFFLLSLLILYPFFKINVVQFLSWQEYINLLYTYLELKLLFIIPGFSV